jgi:hypothetical protein
MTSPYIAKRVQTDIPIWDIFAHGQDIGCATVFDFEDEGPMATVHYTSDKAITFYGTSIRDVLAKVGTYLRAADAEMEAEADAEYYSEVIGPMEAAERLAELRPMEDDPVF